MLKKYLYTLAILTIILGSGSCSDFLNMTPRNKKVVKSVEDHRDIMASYMYFLKTTYRSQVNILGVDPFACPTFDMSKILSIYTGESVLTTTSKQLYNPSSNMHTPLGKSLLHWYEKQEYVWKSYYLFLGPLNNLIKEIKTAEGNDENLRNYVLGEALAWRAFSYFKLLQYYAPYEKNEYGLPMYLTPAEDIGTTMPKRQTQKEVFAQLFTDCNQVLDLLKMTPTTEWNLAYKEDFIYAMMAEMYMWKALSGAKEDNDWKKAKEYAEKAIGSRTLATSTEELKRIFDCGPNAINMPIQSSEFYIRITDNSTLMINFNKSYTENSDGFTLGGADAKFVNLYKANDRRKSFYFKEGFGGEILNDKYNLQAYAKDRGHIGCLMPFRLADMYLIKAEAACRMGDVATATDVLRTFKTSRYDAPETTAGQNAQQVLQEILDERKREFYLENDMLWLEMKRTGVSISRTVDGKTETLEPNDFRYSFPIPKQEMEKNKNMTQNPGWTDIVW